MSSKLRDPSKRQEGHAISIPLFTPKSFAVMRAAIHIALVLLSSFVSSAYAVAPDATLSWQDAHINPAGASAVPAVEQQDYCSGENGGVGFSRDLANCPNSNCLNTDHCHHATLTEMMTTSDGLIASMYRRGFYPQPNHIPVQNIAHAISKPPRA